MKIVFVNKPLQDSKTIDPQIIDGKIYHWVVNAEMLKPNETFQQWWVRKQEWMKNHIKGDTVEGIFFYDIQGIVPYSPDFEFPPSSSGMIIRYQWIKINSEIV